MSSKTLSRDYSDENREVAVILRQNHEDGYGCVIFPSEPGDCAGRYVSLLEELGGHHSGCYSAVIEQTRPASPEVAERLRALLRSYGYNFREYQKSNRVHREIFREQVNNLRALA